MSIKTFDLPDLEGAYVEYWPYRTARVMGRTHTADRNSLHRFEKRLREMAGTRGDNHVVFGIFYGVAQRGDRIAAGRHRGEVEDGRSFRTVMLIGEFPCDRPPPRRGRAPRAAGRSRETPPSRTRGARKPQDKPAKSRRHVTP